MRDRRAAVAAVFLGLGHPDLDAVGARVDAGGDFERGSRGLVVCDAHRDGFLSAAEDGGGAQDEDEDSDYSPRDGDAEAGGGGWGKGAEGAPDDQVWGGQQQDGVEGADGEDG